MGKMVEEVHACGAMITRKQEMRLENIASLYIGYIFWSKKQDTVIGQCCKLYCDF
jgi:hypothetical protein